MGDARKGRSDRAWAWLVAVYLAVPVAAVDGTAVDGTGTGFADLVIQTRNFRLAVLPGQTVDFTVKVRNQGPSAVIGAVVDVPVPMGFGSVSWGVEGVVGPLCGGATNTGALAEIVDLAAGESVVYKVCGEVDAVPTVSNLIHVATVTPPGGVNDPDSTNNWDDDDDPIGPASDLNVTVSNHRIIPNQGFLVPSQLTVYEIIARNKGPSPTDMVEVAVRVPQVLVNATFGSRQGTYDSGTGIWNGLLLQADERATLIVVAEVLSTNQVDEVVVAAQVVATTDLPDPFMGNNQAQDRDIYDATGSVIFADGFGSGDLWAWSDTVGTVANTGVYGGEEE